MGNTHPYIPRIQHQNGNFSSINVRHGEEPNGEAYKEMSVSYNVDDRTATFSMKRIMGRGSYYPREKFMISITDRDNINPLSWRAWPYRFEMMVEKAHEQQQLLKVRYAKTWIVQNNDIFQMVVPLFNVTLPVNIYDQDATKNTKITNTRGGGITETSINPYKVGGYEKQRGLVVIEWKKKGWDQNPYIVIVSHYFASLQNSNSGFSVTATISSEEGMHMEAPVVHPATCLFEMFDRVSRSGVWTPNACPHCASHNSSHIPRSVTVDDPPRQRQFTVLQSSSENNNPFQQWLSSILNNRGARV